MYKQDLTVYMHVHYVLTQSTCTTYLPMLIMILSGIILFFSLPCFGWSPRPRNKPGGSILKLPTRCLWLSIMQKPYSSRICSFCFFRTCFSSFDMFFLSSFFCGGTKHSLECLIKTFKMELQIP